MTLLGGPGISGVDLLLLQPGLGFPCDSFNLLQPSSLLFQLLSLPFQLELQQVQAAVLAQQPHSRLLLPPGSVLEVGNLQAVVLVQDGQAKAACLCLQQGRQLVRQGLRDVQAQGAELPLQRGSLALELSLDSLLGRGTQTAW